MFELYTSKYYRELVQLGPGQPRRPYIAHMVSWIYSESQMVTNLTKKQIFDNKLDWTRRHGLSRIAMAGTF